MESISIDRCIEILDENGINCNWISLIPEALNRIAIMVIG